jgi:ABC-type dipeptide/oligopeptide/nickel transport system ATPase component
MASASYFIPRKTKVKTVFIKGLTSSDLIWLMLGGGATAGLFFGKNIIFYILGIVLALVTLLGMIKESDGARRYESFVWYFRFAAYSKKFSKRKEKGFKDITEIVPYTGVTDDKFINFNEYFASVIEFQPMEFGLLGNESQQMLINAFANALRRLGTTHSGSIMSFEKPFVFDKFIENEISKYEQLVTNVKAGVMTEDELATREIIFNERGSLLEYMNEEEKVYRTAYYMVIYGRKKEELDTVTNGIVASVNVQLGAKRITGKDLVVFLRANYDKFFDENQYDKQPFEERIKWTMPSKIKFGFRKQVINGNPRAGVIINDFPINVGNAWAYTLFNFPGAKTVLNFYQVSKLSAEKQIDKAIIEMRSQEGRGFKESQKIEAQTQQETIQTLLQDLKTGNEQMFNVKLHINAEWKDIGELRNRINENGFRCSNNFGKQIDSFLSTNVSRLDAFDSVERGMATTSLAACFPFISDLLQDDNGVMIGSNSHPVLIDYFKRDNSRVNSNMIIIGKSGSGKSFSTKSILSHLAADNTKIFICDPEKEYVGMARNLHGGSIDVGNAGSGRFNPFHIYPAMLDDDDGGEEFDDSFEGHLRFLESFFKIVMEGIRSDALEALNGLVTKLYKTKGIDKTTKFAQLRPENFPVFDELYQLAKRSYEDSSDEFARINYRVLVTYLEKFATGGRYSGLWNGPTSIKTDENFFVFNFLTLLSNKNTVVANAQMLLVFKYLDGEIIKNREFNIRNHMKRKIIIVVDEAHVFIDEQKPIALDFMFNMAKRIRKYDGMQIVITQNIKDFVGSPIIAKKSAAIINASQYSMIFSLAPNDMTDLVTLYKNAGGINKREQEEIISSPRGQCFFIYGPVSRSTVSIETSDEIRKLFE